MDTGSKTEALPSFIRLYDISQIEYEQLPSGTDDIESPPSLLITFHLYTKYEY